MQDFIPCGLFPIISQAMTNLIFVSISCTLEYFVQSFQQKLAFSALYEWSVAQTFQCSETGCWLISVHTLIIVESQVCANIQWNRLFQISKSDNSLITFSIKWYKLLNRQTHIRWPSDQSTEREYKLSNNDQICFLRMQNRKNASTFLPTSYRHFKTYCIHETFLRPISTRYQWT